MKKVFIGFIGSTFLTIFLSGLPAKMGTGQTVPSTMKKDTTPLKEAVIQKQTEFQKFEVKVANNSDTLSDLVDKVVEKVKPHKKPKVVYRTKYLPAPPVAPIIIYLPCDTADSTSVPNYNDYVNDEPQTIHDTVYISKPAKFFLFKWFSKKQKQKK